MLEAVIPPFLVHLVGLLLVGLTSLSPYLGTGDSASIRAWGRGIGGSALDFQKAFNSVRLRPRAFFEALETSTAGMQ
jgi:hypothetical protein